MTNTDKAVTRIFGLAKRLYVPPAAKDSTGSEITFDYDELKSALTQLLNSEVEKAVVAELKDVKRWINNEKSDIAILAGITAEELIDDRLKELNQGEKNE